MDSGLYAAYTGLLARTQALDTAANNLANAGTNGFRAQRDYFRGVLSSGLVPGEQNSQVGAGTNTFGVLGGSLADLGQGPLTTTANPLDLAIDGQGFFALRTGNGIRYTRDGSFIKSPTGELESTTGEPVLNVAGGPITLPSGTLAISADGTISVNGAVVDHVGVFALQNPQAEGANRFTAAGATLQSGAQVRQGAIEGANQDAVHGTMQLILVQRQAEMMQKALTVFDQSFNKAATEELGRI